MRTHPHAVGRLDQFHAGIAPAKFSYHCTGAIIAQVIAYQDPEALVLLCHAGLERVCKGLAAIECRDDNGKFLHEPAKDESVATDHAIRSPVKNVILG